MIAEPKVLASIKADPVPWWTDRNEIARLLLWLQSRFEIDEGQIYYLIEKPWKWQKEYEHMNGVKAGTHGACDLCDEITDQKANDVFVCKDCLPF